MNANLTRRQDQIAGLISCGMAQKEIADELKISVHTVDNTLRAVYNKTGLGKINELTGWWITRHFQIFIDFKELRKQIIAFSFLVLIIFQIVAEPDGIIRTKRARRLRNEDEIEYFILND